MVAVSENGVIGKENTLPWKLRSDLAFFKKTTMGAALIMGRKNHEDIGRALPGRLNIVLSRSKDVKVAEGCVLLHSVQEALDYCIETNQENAFLIGGGELYKQGLGLCESLFVTEVKADIDGDVFFEYDKADWEKVWEETHEKDEKNDYDYTFVEYKRK